MTSPTKAAANETDAAFMLAMRREMEHRARVYPSLRAAAEDALWALDNIAALVPKGAYVGCDLDATRTQLRSALSAARGQATEPQA